MPIQTIVTGKSGDIIANLNHATDRVLFLLQCNTQVEICKDKFRKILNGHIRSHQLMTPQRIANFLTLLSPGPQPPELKLPSFPD